MTRRPVTRRIVIGALIAVAALFFVSGVLVYGGYQRFMAAGPSTEERSLLIPKGKGVGGISRLLEDSGIISDRLIFRFAARLQSKGQSLKAGEYVFPAAISMQGVLNLLVRGETLIRRVTVPEGLTSREVVDVLTRTEGLDGIIAEVPEEGSLLPETYHFSHGDPRRMLLQRMSDALNQTLQSLWPERRDGLPFETPREALVLASIVERETGLADERPLVASVFINRLNKGMRLQSDPTVAYGLNSSGEAPGRALTRKDLKAPSPYNTYLIHGLPPGPIANVGRAALEAVLKPADTAYLYFVADGTGGHAFAETLEEHNRNVAKWRKIQKKRRQTGD